MKDLGLKKYKTPKSPKGWKQDKRTEAELLGNSVSEPKKKKLKLSKIPMPDLVKGQDLDTKMKEHKVSDSDRKYFSKKKKKKMKLTPLQQMRKDNDALGKILSRQKR